MSDLVLACLIQLCLLPLMLMIAIAVKVTSPGPVIFKQRRYGLYGEEIIVYKFRSMTVSEDGAKVVQATKDDQRLTRIGAFLRRSSLDECAAVYQCVARAHEYCWPATARSCAQ